MVNVAERQIPLLTGIVLPAVLYKVGYGSVNLLAPSSYSNFLSYRSLALTFKEFAYNDRPLFACIGWQARFTNQCNAHAHKTSYTQNVFAAKLLHCLAFLWHFRDCVPQ